MPAYTTTRGIDGKVIMEARESRKLTLKVQYLDYLPRITESDCLIVPMQAYDLVLGIPWFGPGILRLIGKTAAFSAFARRRAKLNYMKDEVHRPMY